MVYRAADLIEEMLSFRFLPLFGAKTLADTEKTSNSTTKGQQMSCKPFNIRTYILTYIHTYKCIQIFVRLVT